MTTDVHSLGHWMGVHHQCCIKRILKLNWYKAKVCNKLLVGLSAICSQEHSDIHKFILGYHLEGTTYCLELRLF